MPFGLLNKIMGGSLIVCGLVIAGLWFALWATDRSRDKYRDQLSKANAQIELISAQGEKLKADVKRAQAKGDTIIIEGRKQADRVRDTEPNGCPTPAKVLEADL